MLWTSRTGGALLALIQPRSTRRTVAFAFWPCSSLDFLVLFMIPSSLRVSLGKAVGRPDL